MPPRRTRSFNTPDNSTAEMKNSNKKNQTVEATYKKLQNEKKVAEKQLETLKYQYSVVLEETEKLGKSISNVEREIEIKDGYVEKYRTKRDNIKGKIAELQKDINVFESKAETANARIVSLNKAKKLIEERKNEIFLELEDHKQAFLLYSLEHRSNTLDGNHNKYHYSGVYNEGRSLEHTNHRPYYQPSQRNYHRRSPVEHRHRR